MSPSLAADNLTYMKPAQATVISEIEEVPMSDQERTARLEALWRRMMDPDGLDWQTLENVEQLTQRTP
jgi:hypothetical protein